MTAQRSANARRTTVFISIVGALAVAGYAVWAAVHILVVNPLAAVPGSSIEEIYAMMADAGESSNTVWVFGILGFGILLAVASAWVCIAADAPPIVALAGALMLLVLGAPAYFIASFSPSMALADTYLISGGSHSLWHLPLYASSALAAIAIIVIVLVLMIRTRNEPDPV